MRSFNFSYSASFRLIIFHHRFLRILCSGFERNRQSGAAPGIDLLSLSITLIWLLPPQAHLRWDYLSFSYRLFDGVGCAPVGMPTTTQPLCGVHATFHSIGRSSGGGRVGGRSGGKTIGCSGCGCGAGPPMSTYSGGLPPQNPSGGPPPPGIGPPPTSKPVSDAMP
jgi:hypothetical protein